MGFQVSPGVEVKEIDLTTVIPAVSTSIGGFVGSFEWGPVKDITLISSEDKLAARFGTPGSNVPATDFLTAASFLSYAGALKVVRVIETETSDATTPAKNAASGKFSTLTFVSIPSDVEVGDTLEQFSVATVGGTQVTTVLAKGVVVEVNVGTNSIVVNHDSNEVFSTSVGLTLRRTRFNSITNQTSVVELSVDPTVVQIGNRNVLILNEKQVEEEVVNPAVAGTFVAKYPGQYGNSIKIVVLTEDNWVPPRKQNDPVRPLQFESDLFDSKPLNSKNEIHVVIIDADGKFTGIPGTVLETYAFLQTNPGAKKDDGSNNYYADVLNLGSGFVYVGDTSGLSAGVYTLAGGTNGTPVGNDEVQFGWDLFKDAEVTDVNLLVIGSQPPIIGQYVTQNIAERRKDCVVFISPEKSDVVGNATPLDDVLAFRSALNINSSYAVMDSGWKYVYNKYQDRFEWIPLCADTAGLCARTDSERDPWFSPAGFNRGNVKNVIKLAYNPDQADRDELYKSGINPVVNFKGVGPVLFGDKTLLVRPSAFDRINVRRLFIVLEKAIATAAKFSLFELNDQFTRAQFVALVEPFLREVQARRGIFDFRVVCDETNNTGEVIDTNRFIGDIYIKPARSINFITLNFVAVRTGVDFAEVVGKF